MPVRRGVCVLNSNTIKGKDCRTVPSCICIQSPIASSGHSSAIEEHLLNINAYQINYSEDFFSVLHRVQTKYHLNILEAMVIEI